MTMNDDQKKTLQASFRYRRLPVGEISRNKRLNVVPDLVCNLFDASRRIEDLHSLGVFVRNGIIAALHTAEEFAVGLFETIPLNRAARRTPGFAHGHWHTE